MDAQAGKKDLYPKINPYGDGMLSLDGDHVLYWEQSGNPDGVPVIFLHGGPGAGANPAHRRFFDPDFYRIIILDQRGSGRSKPFSELSDNTTDHLVEDIEALRQHLGIEKWLIFGGSWGSTLGLTYGIRHPDRCAGFVLRGIFLGSKGELDWFLHGIRTVFPEAWRDFSGFLPDEEQTDIVEGYLRRLNDSDPAVHLPAAAAWNRYEASCSVLMTEFDEGKPATGGPGGLALARIEAHYFKHAMFLDDGYILKNIGALQDIPAIIIQGRYDMICPIVTADKLAGAWPEAKYRIIPDAGHSAMETGIRTALIKATEDIKSRL